MIFDIERTVSGALLMGLVVLAGVLAWKATQSASKFDFAEAFLDADGKTSMGRICVFVALAVSTWGMVVLVQTDKLTDSYFTIYIGAFVVNGLGSKFLDGRK